jgi:hypothetical protein
MFCLFRRLLSLEQISVTLERWDGHTLWTALRSLALRAPCAAATGNFQAAGGRRGEHEH